MAHNARQGGSGTVRPARPELTGAPCYMAMCSVFGGFSSNGTGGVQGTHQGGLLPAGGSRVGCVAARFKLQPLAMVGGHSKSRLTARLGKTGAVQNVEHRCRVDGARGASHAAWR
jgi:hypothetical protein